MPRIIGSGSKLATGASPGSFGGDALGRSRIDHRHKLWDSWEELPVASGWEDDPTEDWRAGLWICRASNLVEINGYLEVTNPVDPAPDVIVVAGGIPEIYRPEKNLLHVALVLFDGLIPIPFLMPIRIGTDGSLTYLDPSNLGAGSETLIFILFNNFYYRTDV